jgi:hypothetical protein
MSHCSHPDPDLHRCVISWCFTVFYVPAGLCPKIKNPLKYKDFKGFCMELMTRFELVTSSLPRELEHKQVVTP